MMKNKKNISLIGMPAVGKTTVGKLLARKIKYNFLDSDDLIESKEQKTLSMIIAQKGLDRFLQIEESCILDLECSHHVIATGGSVVYSKKAMVYLSEISMVIYLSISLDILLTRLNDIHSRGVAICSGKTMEDLYKERTPLYDTCSDIKIDCGLMTAGQVVEKIIQLSV